MEGDDAMSFSSRICYDCLENAALNRQPTTIFVLLCAVSPPQIQNIVCEVLEHLRSISLRISVRVGPLNGGRSGITYG
jgi:hypothetical protein